MKTVLFEPYPKQLEMFEAVFSGKYDTIIYGGAMGGGKTYAFCALLMLLCRLYPESRWIVLRKNMPSMVRTVLKTWKKILPKNYFDHVASSPDVIYRAKNGAEVVFMAENFQNDKDLDRFKSLECNGFFIEQIEEIQEKTYEMCHIRAGRWKVPSNPPRLVMASVNPTHLWPKSRFYEPFEAETLPENICYIKALVDDNPALAEDEGYMKGAFGQLDDLTYRRMRLGDWNAMAVDRPFAYEFKEHKHVTTGLFYQEHLPLYLSFDFNVNPMTCIASQHGEDWIWVIKEFRLKNNDIFGMCERIKAEYYTPARQANLIVTGDASGKNRYAGAKKTMYQTIEEELNIPKTGIHLPAKNPRVTAANDSILTSQTMVNRMLRHHPHMRIDKEGCPYLIDDLKYVEVNENNQIDKDSDKRRTHLLDCFRYYLWTFHKSWRKVG